MPEPRRESSVKPYLKGLAMIVSLVAIGYGLKALGLSDMFDTNWIDSEVKDKGATGEMIFFGMAALITAVGFPRQVVAFLGGYAFGFVEGTLLSLAGALAGCAIAFAYARILGRSLVQRHFSRKIAKFEAVLAERPFVTTLLIRFLPVGSNVVTNLIAGVSKVRATPFILGSAVGYLPQTVVFVLVGSGVHINPTLRIGLGVALFVISAALGVYLLHDIRRNLSVDDEAENPR